MTKKELVESVAKQTGIGLAETASTVDTFIETLRKSVMAGKPVFIRGFGTFKMKTKAEKKARDIKRNTMITVPERRVPTFKISKNFAEI